MVILHIVRRDLLRFIRNPMRTALLFAVPLVVAGIFVLVFGGDAGERISIRVLLWDEDESLLSRFLQGAGNSEDAKQRLEVVPVGAEGLAMMDRGEASALVHLPQGFTRALLDGTPTQVELVKNPAQRFLPQVVEEGVMLGASVASVGVRVLRPELDLLRPMMDAEQAPEDLAVATLSTSINRRMQQVGTYVFPPIVTLETTTVEGNETDASSTTAAILGAMLPGLAMMGIFFIAQTATRDIIQERSSGLLRQLLTAPVSTTDYLLGKSLSTVLVSGLGFMILALLGAAAGLDWGPLPQLSLMILAAAVAASGTLLLLMSLVNTERQGDALTTIVILVWAMLGGAFVPISAMPEFLRPVSASSLIFWAVDGFQEIMPGNANLSAVLPNLAVLGGCGALFLVVGAWRLKRRMVVGGAS